MFRTLILACLLLATAAQANDWEALDQPGAMAIMRHALAPGVGDPDTFALDDCSTQRNLDARGRAQTERIGAAFRERGHSFDKVLTSQWCRTRETAELLDLGPVEDAPPLNSFFRGRGDRGGQTDETLALIVNADGPLMLVTHQVNISALTGRATRSGEVLVFRLVDGVPEVTGSILIAP
ncbi:histidine phosphatase family protein [Sulfitobacter alexandrii]|uniref:Histidine phosphatase family protein n=1 Tax=Sulfitobacter alexandrii TaxID=1917485 RepID=A0A1J0WHS4_9RHOB|nr:histidine phosphatase family protein [Sulfitobacter alexandrii]APE43879.1 histidine phosphatase family protein [Sulfitobacter alexandrii]